MKLGKIICPSGYNGDSCQKQTVQIFDMGTYHGFSYCNTGYADSDSHLRDFVSSICNSARCRSIVSTSLTGKSVKSLREEFTLKENERTELFFLCWFKSHPNKICLLQAFLGSRIWHQTDESENAESYHLNSSMQCYLSLLYSPYCNTCLLSLSWMCLLIIHSTESQDFMMFHQYII